MGLLGLTSTVQSLREMGGKGFFPPGAASKPRVRWCGVEMGALVWSQETKSMGLSSEEEGRGTLLQPSESLFLFHEKCLLGNHGLRTASSSHGNAGFFLPKQSLGAERSSWWSKALIWGWCWGLKVFRVVNTAKKNQQGSSNQPFPPHIPRLPQNISHRLPPPPRLWQASRGGHKFHGSSRMLNFCDLTLWLCLSETKLEVPSTLCPFLPSTTTGLWWHPCGHLLHRGQASERDLPVLQIRFFWWASN